MNALLLQILLLLTAAFFVGAVIACGLRRLVAPARTTAAAAMAGESRTVEPLPGMATRLPAHENVARFEKALGSEPPRPAPLPVPASLAVPPPVPQPVPPPPPRALDPVPTPSTRPHAPVTPPVPHLPVELVVPAPPRITPSPATPSAAPLAAAAAAAAVVVAQVVRPAPAAPVAATPVTPVPVPTLAAPSVTLAPVQTPVVVTTSTVADDLTRIRGIDKTMAASLTDLGINRYSQIAGWMRPDVTRVNQALGLKGRVERENWIEQAQILTNGGQTLFSRRLASLPPTTAPAAPAAGAPHVTPVVAAPSAPIAATVATAAASLKTDDQTTAGSPQPTSMPRPSGPLLGAVTAGVAAAAAAAAAAAMSSRAAQSMAPARVADATPAAAAPEPAVAERAAFAAERTAPAAAPMPAPVAASVPAPGPIERTLPAGPPAAAVPIVPPSVTPVRPSMTPNRDALQRISGINPEIERLLNVQGISRYSQIGGWGTGEVERFDRLLGSPGRVRRENWIEQAQILARGGDTSASRSFDREPPNAPTAAATAAARLPIAADIAQRPARLAEAISAQQAAPAVAAPVAAVAAATPAARSDMSSLRSVKSEAFQSRGAGTARAGPPDDLKRIRGVGVLIEKRLNAMGITNYDQIANWTAEDISRFSQQLDFKGRIERENWVEQARILAAGGFTEFSRRVDRGEVESSRTRT